LESPQTALKAFQTLFDPTFAKADKHLPAHRQQKARLARDQNRQSWCTSRAFFDQLQRNQFVAVFARQALWIFTENTASELGLNVKGFGISRALWVWTKEKTKTKIAIKKVALVNYY